MVIAGVFSIRSSFTGGQKQNELLNNYYTVATAVNVNVGTMCTTGWEYSGSDSCPTWMEPSPDSACCVCGDTISGAVMCNSTNVSIRVSYCMTYDSVKNITYLAKCPYNTGGSPLFINAYYPLPLNRSELNMAMCGPFSRHDRLCGRCKPGYGPGVFSANVNCFRCSGPYHGWLLYLVFELVPVTVMFLLVMIFQWRVSNGTFNGFIFFAQMVASIYQFYHPDHERSYPISRGSQTLITIYQVVYGLFNFDFLRQLVPPFCVSEHISSLQMISLFYLPVFYSLLLSVITYMLIEMHAHNCRLLVWVWRPFHKYFVRITRHVNPQTSLIDAFVVTLILSYSRLLFVSFDLIHPVRLYLPSGEAAQGVVYHDGSLDYFSIQHLPYGILGITVLVVFNVLPMVFLCVYPTKAFQKLLGRSGLKRTAGVLHTFADTFQGCYKNGTDGTRDYRYFAGFYFFLRIIVCIGHVAGGAVAIWMVPGSILLVTALLFANLRPYRCNFHNTLDSLLFTSGIVYTVCQIVLVIAGPSPKSTWSYQMASEIILGVPLLYLIFLVILNISILIKRQYHQRTVGGRQTNMYNMVNANTE